MINVSTIMAQIQNWLEIDPNLADFIIERSEFLNEDAGRAADGWIGLYRQSVDYAGNPKFQKRMTGS